jgi:PAS domain S-box-containing protein
MGEVANENRTDYGGERELQRPMNGSRHPKAAVQAEKVNILVVDDRAENLVTLAAILDQPDLNLVKARSGKEALRCLLKQEFAAILLDVNMPEMDGFETASVIRQRKSTAHTPIIFVTAYSDDDHISKGYSLGAVDYILTPVQPDVLRAKIGVFVELFRKKLEVQRQAEILRELEVHEHRRLLSETNERLRLALEAGHMGAWEWDLGSHLMNWSPTLEEIFGLEAGQFSGSIEELRARLHPDDRDRVMSTIYAAVEIGSEFSMEHRILRPDGRVSWVELRGKVFGDKQGNARRLAGVCMDITERKRVQDELAAHRARLEELVMERTEELRASHERIRRSERLASLGTLAAGIAHEINNPINAILLSAQYARETIDDPATIKSLDEMLSGIMKEAKRCGAIVKNVLRFAKEEKAPKGACQLNDIVNRAVTLAKTYVQAPNLNIVAQVDPAVPPLMLNQTQIEQVLVNLVQNAVQAACGGVTVRLQSEVCSDCVRLIVSDDGPGIPQEKLLYIFDPFYSTRQNQGGTGLGLSIAHGIISDHGGSIDVISEVGCGTTFVLQFPLPASLARLEGDTDAAYQATSA